MVQEPAKAKKPSKKKAAKKKSQPARVGSGGLVTSNQPGLHPMQPIEPPRSRQDRHSAR